MGYTSYVKDPQAVLDYVNNWADWLNDTDVIADSTWTASTGITIDTDSHTDNTTTVWLSGGEAGKNYLVTNHIVTAEGREDDKSILIKMKEL